MTKSPGETGRDADLVERGLLTQKETTLPQWAKRTLIDLRNELQSERDLRAADEDAAADSAIFLRDGMKRRHMGTRWTDVRVALDPTNPDYEYVDAQLIRHGEYAGWVQVMTSRSLELHPISSNAFYVRPLPYRSTPPARRTKETPR